MRCRLRGDALESKYRSVAMLRRVVFGCTDSFEASLPSALIVGIRKESFVLYPLVVSPSGPGDQIIPVACGVQEDADYNYLVVVADLWD